MIFDLNIKPYEQCHSVVHYLLQKAMPTNNIDFLKDYLLHIPCHRYLYVKKQGECYFSFFNNYHICDYFVVDYSTVEHIIENFGSIYQKYLFKECYFDLSEEIDFDWMKEGF